MTTKDWITKNLPELNQNQVTMLEHYIAEREREASRREKQLKLAARIQVAELEAELKPYRAFAQALTQQTIKEREE